MELKQTPLAEVHRSLGGKMVPFAGYEMAIQYKDGIINEHNAVRQSAGVFDVSHMGQVILVGQGVDKFLSSLTPTDFSRLNEGECKYTVLTNNSGGIIDDLIITKLATDKFFIVINACCKEKDIAWIESQLPIAINFKHLATRALIAIQGPEAENILQKVLTHNPSINSTVSTGAAVEFSPMAENDSIDLSKLGYMKAAEGKIFGHDIIITRTGYTGEDGFEISIEGEVAGNLWNDLINNGARPAGLGCRDTLRLEMGYPLYGHDIDDETTPIEAGLGWVMTKEHNGFIGAHTLLSQVSNGVNRRRVGMIINDKIVAREGAEIFKDGKKIGTITSGGFSPSVNKPIAMGYISKEFAKEGTNINVMVRGREYKAEVKKFPFVKAGTKK